MKVSLAGFDRVADANAIDTLGRKIELIRGEIIRMSAAVPIHDDLIEYLAIEMAHSNLRDDRRTKANLYREMRILENGMVKSATLQVHILTRPQTDVGYADQVTMNRDKRSFRKCFQKTSWTLPIFSAVSRATSRINLERWSRALENASLFRRFDSGLQ